MNQVPTARDRTIEVLRGRGIRHIFGNPGTTELSLISALPSDIDYILCLQEAIAVGAATGHALIGGTPSVVSLHALPGIGHAMGALHGARLMHAPVVALVGQQHSHHLHREPLLSGDIVETARPAARWANQPARPQDVATAVERAFRIATSPPMGPAVVAVPMDFWDEPAGPAVVGSGAVRPVVPGQAVDATQSLLEGANNGVLVTGDAITDEASWDAAVRIAERYDLSVYAAPIGVQPGFPTDHPRFAGTLPLSAGAIRRVLDGADAALVVGAPIFTLYLHDGASMLPEGVDVVMVTDDPDEAARAPVSRVHLGDPSAFLVDLARGCDAASERSTAEQPDEVMGDLDLDSTMAIVATRAPREAVFIDESMTAGRIVRSHLRVRGPRRFIRTSTGVLGTGMSAAVGAAVAEPNRPIVAIVGDGALLFAPQALWTAARNGLRLVVIVLNNGGYESLRGYHRSNLQHFGSSSSAFDVDGVDIPGLASSFGVHSEAITTCADLDRVFAAALDRDGPTVIDVRLHQ